MGKMESSYTLSEDARGAATVENSMEVPEKVNTGEPWHLATPLLGSDLENTTIRNNTCTHFQEALFTKAKTWSPPKRQATGT